MTTRKTLSPDQALKRFLAVVAEEADMNAGFRNRLLLALGVPVLFEGQDDIMSISPVELVVRYDQDTFRRIYATLKPPALQKVLKESGLATKDDLAFPKSMKALDAVADHLARDRLVERRRVERLLGGLREAGQGQGQDQCNGDNQSVHARVPRFLCRRWQRTSILAEG